MNLSCHIQKIQTLLFSCLYRFPCWGIQGCRHIVAEGRIFIPQPAGKIRILGRTRFCRQVELSVAGGEFTIGGGFVGPFVTISCHRKIRIGRSVLLANGVAIHDNNHGIDRIDVNIVEQPFVCREVWIGDDVWIGTRAVILPGVRIGSHAVVGAGSIVTRDVPDWAVVAGNPARLIRMRNSAPDPACGSTSDGFEEKV
ncbi:acyltransferase [bacterium]|nr:acyltransferase [bacterium]